ncbi:1393_t:CDS:2 [Gigaspora margarita]|uniref:glutathione transferase n=1 Tax=Gigaspora margarita TaxID=4874 RepID=A0ABN7W144_GIGMA|nr:1393_t:CDS:2 [Gigaspora margarita]
MTIKVIGFARSTNTLRVISCLNELGIPYQLEPPADFAAIKKDDYLANKHPFGKIPVLYDGDYKISESRAICRYLVSKYQGKYNNTILIPHDVHEAGLVDQFIFYESFYYEPVVAKIIIHEIVLKTPESEIAKRALKDLDKVLGVYDKLLEGKEYLNGEFSLADLFHYPCAHFIYSSHADLWDKRPNVKKWLNRLRNRDAWKASLEKKNKL